MPHAALSSSSLSSIRPHSTERISLVGVWPLEDIPDVSKRVLLGFTLLMDINLVLRAPHSPTRPQPLHCPAAHVCCLHSLDWQLTLLW